MWLQNQRRGHFRLHDIGRPDLNHWDSCLGAMECALHLEMSLNQSLLNLYRVGTEKKDSHLCNFLEHHYLHEQVKSINQLVDQLTNLHMQSTSLTSSPWMTATRTEPGLPSRWLWGDFSRSPGPACIWPYCPCQTFP